MTDFVTSAIMTDGHNKRATDALPNSLPTNRELLDAIIVTQREVVAVKTMLSNIDDAFLTNDIGKKDYEGHRLDHLHRKMRSESFENAKLAGTLKIVGIVLAAIVTIFTTGLSVHIQRILGQ